MSKSLRHPYYILRGKQVVPAINLEQWAREFEKAHRVIERTNFGDEIKVSTVFLGIDHSFRFKGPPILFETMVFGGKLDGEMDRYATWDEAEIGHVRMVERVRESLRDRDDQSVVAFPTTEL